MHAIERRDLGPNQVWLGNTEWYLDLTDYTITHDGEKIGTNYSVAPTVLLLTELVRRGVRGPEGFDIKGPTETWFEISRQLMHDPAFRFEFTSKPIKFEEFLAGAYKLQGWDAVTLTPPSGDKGRDVIATTSAMTAIRILDQAKANRPSHLVSQNDVRALLGVLVNDDNATKGVVTTTSDFAPGVEEEFQKHIPYRLETKNGEQVLQWVRQLMASQTAVLQRPEPKLIAPPAGIIMPKIVPAGYKFKRAGSWQPGSNRGP